MFRIRITLCLLLVSLLSAPVACGQSCPALSVPQVVPGTNMFSAQQEVWLGDAQAAGLEQSITIFNDKNLTGHLQAIVERLAENAPPEHVPFRVKMIDVTTAEAFSIAGGRIYISRKIVALMRNEDELAGVLAHEMGHIIAHHAAITTSQALRKVLGVTQVGDRDDVFAKWNELLSNARRQKGASYDKAMALEEREQAQADTVALYLVTRAGYSPKSFEGFFDRLAETKGNAGGFWSNFFGTTKPDSKRLGQIIRNTPAMPSQCVSAPDQASGSFDQWQKNVIEYSSTGVGREESVPGLLSKRVLTERLRPEVQYIRISPDGKYVIAQDDSHVFILNREPLKPIWRFDAAEAGPAQFTPDSQAVILLFGGLYSSPRVERWDIASQRRTEVHEIYVRDGCLHSKVAPDGRTLFCLTREITSNEVRFDLELYDIATGTSFFQKKGWIKIDSASIWRNFRLMAELENLTEKWLSQLSPSAFSPDGRFFLARGPQGSVAMDLSSRSEIGLPGNIKGLLDYSFAFLANGNLAGVAGSAGEKSEVVEFPSGRVVYKDLKIGGSQLDRAAHGDYLVLRPIKDHPIGIFDLKQNKIVLASKRSALDLWNDRYIAERLDGELQVFELATVTPVEHAQLPDAPLGRVRADALSPDLTWLAVSQKTRGAVWNLQTGQRLYHLRGFSAAYFATDGLYADFPKYLSTERTIARIALNASDIMPARTLDETQHTIEVGRYLLTTTPTKENNTFKNVNFELWDLVDEKMVWTKQVEHERPGYYVNARANTLVFYWQASSQSAKSIAKDDQRAAAAIERFKDKDSALFLQVFDLDTGTLRAETAIDTGKHSFQVTEALATQDRLIIADNQKRVLVYTLDGEQKGIVAGQVPEVSPGSDLMTVQTEPGELQLYDLRDVQQRRAYEFNSRVACDDFSGDGKRLLVLTADQVVYVLDATANNKTEMAGK